MQQPFIQNKFMGPARNTMVREALVMREALIISTAEDKDYILALLTEKEKLVWQYCCSERTYKEIGVLMGVSEKAVKRQVSSVHKKLHVHNRQGLIMLALKINFMYPNL